MSAISAVMSCDVTRPDWSVIKMTFIRDMTQTNDSPLDGVSGQSVVSPDQTGLYHRVSVYLSVCNDVRENKQLVSHIF